MSIEFPIVVGDYVEKCLTLAAAENSIDELAFYHLTSHTARSYFDLYNKTRMVVGVKFKHKFHLEDYWANAKDDLEIKKRMFSKLSLNMIRLCEVIQVPDQVKEEGM